MLRQNDRNMEMCIGRRVRGFLRFALPLAIVTAAIADDQPSAFEFSTVRVRSAVGVPIPKPLAKKPLAKKEHGRLSFSDSGVSYRSQDGKTSFEIPYRDIREADVSDSRKIRLKTYDILKRNPFEHRSYEFRLNEGHGLDLARFLAERLKRPVIGLYDVGAEAQFRVPAYHRHVFGGAPGVIEIGPDGIQFKTERVADSRTWLYRDIQTIGSPGPFSFRITTETETYNFDLKERLPEGAYDLAWSTLYNLGPVQVYASDPSEQGRLTTKAGR